MVIPAATHLHFLSPLLVAALGHQEKITVVVADQAVAAVKIILDQAAQVHLGKEMQVALALLALMDRLEAAVAQEKQETPMAALAVATHLGVVKVVTV